MALWRERAGVSESWLELRMNVVSQAATVVVSATNDATARNLRECLVRIGLTRDLQDAKGGTGAGSSAMDCAGPRADLTSEGKYSRAACFAARSTADAGPS